MIFKSIYVYPKYPDNLKNLYELANNLWAIWNYEAISLFYRIDTRLFREVDHNPLKFLNSLSKERLLALSEDEGFLIELENIWQKFQNYLKHNAEFKNECPQECCIEQDDIIAYFSMEYGLHESILTYAGGLGVLAGDFLKGASDLDLPIVGIGLLYKFGYFTQHIDIDGYQQESFSRFESHLVPIRELHDAQGNWAHISIKILNKDIKVKLWKIEIGKATLILLDTDIEDNPPDMREITSELYVTDRERRIQQELVLGLGGVEALKQLGYDVKIYHFNEGHSAFAILGRLQELMKFENLSFSEAKAIIRHSTIFTTHTPVIAGNENFEMGLVQRYIEPIVKDMGLSFDQIAKFGYADHDTQRFWLPAFAMHFSRFVNGVSVQHANSAKKMWSCLFPQRTIAEIPIIPITNGVHFSWISAPFTEMFDRYLGPDYRHCGNRQDIWSKIYNIPDEELWEEHRRNKKDLVNFIRRRFRQQIKTSQRSLFRKHQINLSLNTDYLTVVFARRFAEYKRPTLILADKERFRKILTNPTKPVQMIFAGKAHPADERSKQMIKEIIDFAQKYQVEDRVVFLENYDINIARHLYWGADVWLNNPTHEMEASGTSGMKAAMNGVLHLSTLEGWWCEGFNGKNGWAITAGRGFSHPTLQDSADAGQLYEILENEVTEMYYNRNEADLSQDWIQMMKDSIFYAAHNFNINRTICDYLTKAYIPSRKQLLEICKDDRRLLKEAIEQEKEVVKNWDNIRFASFSTNIEKKDHLTEGETVEIKCSIRYGQTPPELFTVELFYSKNGEQDYSVMPMERIEYQNQIAHYRYAFALEGYGTQELNVRLKPANEIVQDIHPELIKWKE